jgi:hypothetical protein
MRTHADPLTIAYIAIGALDAIRAADNGPGDLGTSEDGFILDIVSDALALDAEADPFDDRFTGVFNYDVAQPYGERVAAAWLESGEFPTDEERASWRAELIAANTR